MSDAGAIYRATAESVEATNRLSRLALELAGPLTRILEAAPEDDGSDGLAVVTLELHWVELRKARAALELISDPDW